MNEVKTLGDAIIFSSTSLWGIIVSYLPSIIGAVIVLVAGWIVAVVLGSLVEKFFKKIKLDHLMKKMDPRGNLANNGIDFHLSVFLGACVKWFLALIFLMAAAEALGLEQISSFLGDILNYLPNVIIAAVILAVVVIFGNFIYKIVRGSSKAAGVVSATMVAAIAKWSIIIFGVMAALLQLGIASAIIQTIIIGIVAMLALAGGLAFGLGGKDEAQMILRKIREEISERK